MRDIGEAKVEIESKKERFTKDRERERGKENEIETAGEKAR